MTGCEFIVYVLHVLVVLVGFDGFGAIVTNTKRDFFYVHTVHRFTQPFFLNLQLEEKT